MQHRRLRSFSQTPAAVWSARRVVGFPVAMTWAFLFGSNMSRGDWPWWMFTATVVALLAFELAALGTPRAMRRTQRVLRDLHARLPWFRADAVEWLEPRHVGELRDALASLGAVVHELDGASIGSADDLARTIGARFGARSFPSDPLQRVVATLAALPGRGKAVHAVVWTGADRLAVHDPATMHRLLTAWMAKPPSAVLLFLVAPAPAARDAQPLEAPQPAIQPEVAQLASAPSRAWWRRRPGDLT